MFHNSQKLRASLAMADIRSQQSHEALLQDIHALSSTLDMLTDSCQTTSDEVKKLQEGQQQLELVANTHREDLEVQLHKALQTIRADESRLTQAEKIIKEFEKRFSIIFPILCDFKEKAQTMGPPPVDLLAKVQNLSNKVDELTTKEWQVFNQPVIPAAASHSSAVWESDFWDIKHQLKTLQHCIVGGGGEGVKIGSKVFQSFEDVQLWVKSELPIRRYGLFVDTVSILDFFSCLGHIDSKNQVSTLHNASKAGFTSIYKSRVATSVQNIFPKVFGKGDSHQYLPAIRQPDKWDDGTDGLMYQITRGMTDVEFQLSSAIDSILDPYPEAKTITSQCLFKQNAL